MTRIIAADNLDRTVFDGIDGLISTEELTPLITIFEKETGEQAVECREKQDFPGPGTYTNPSFVLWLKNRYSRLIQEVA